MSEGLCVMKYRAHEFDDLLDLFHEGARGVVEQQVRLVEEEADFGLVEIANLRHRLVELGEHPQQERRIEKGRLHEPHAMEHVDVAVALGIELQPIVDVEGGLAEEDVAAGVFELQQRALDGPDRLRGDLAVGQGVVLGMLADVADHRAKVFQVEQQQALIVGNVEHDVQDTFLHIGEIEQASEENGAHFGNRRATRNSAFAVHIPETRRTAVEVVIMYAKLRKTLNELLRCFSWHGNARYVAFHVGKEDRDAGIAHGLGDGLERDRLSRARGACDQTVSVSEFGEKVNRFRPLCDLQLSVDVHECSFASVDELRPLYKM